jgi:hypothetical protein
MYYTIQNDFGQVYDGGELPPEADLTAAEWADRLMDEICLEDLGENAIRVGEVTDLEDGSKDRVVVTIKPNEFLSRERIERVHWAVCFIALSSLSKEEY